MLYYSIAGNFGEFGRFSFICQYLICQKLNIGALFAQIHSFAKLKSAKMDFLPICLNFPTAKISRYTVVHTNNAFFV